MQMTLEVEDLSVRLTEPPKQILSSICANVGPGQILAVMGPSGSGKTTLLSAMSGRMKSKGRILLNGQQLNKRLRRNICYVLQNDVFFSNLTLKQTLIYSAQLRLPESMSYKEKMSQVNHVIDLLDLNQCQNTIIGDYMRRGLSGGEKKRASIASELLSNPSVMFLDEPTSSLDSCSALNLMNLLKNYAQKERKTIIVTIHQPSSQIFHLFDKLLLLSQGKMTFFGPIQQVIPYFAQLGWQMQPSFNPADFLIEAIKLMSDDELNKFAQEAREYYYANKCKFLQLHPGASAQHQHNHHRELHHHHHHHHQQQQQNQNHSKSSHDWSSYCNGSLMLMKAAQHNNNNNNNNNNSGSNNATKQAQNSQSKSIVLKLANSNLAAADDATIKLEQEPLLDGSSSGEHPSSVVVVNDHHHHHHHHHHNNRQQQQHHTAANQYCQKSAAAAASDSAANLLQLSQNIETSLRAAEKTAASSATGEPQTASTNTSVKGDTQQLQVNLDEQQQQQVNHSGEQETCVDKQHREQDNDRTNQTNQTNNNNNNNKQQTNKQGSNKLSPVSATPHHHHHHHHQHHGSHHNHHNHHNHNRHHHHQHPHQQHQHQHQHQHQLRPTSSAATNNDQHNNSGSDMHHYDDDSGQSSWSDPDRCSLMSTYEPTSSSVSSNNDYDDIYSKCLYSSSVSSANSTNCLVATPSGGSDFWVIYHQNNNQSAQNTQNNGQAAVAKCQAGSNRAASISAGNDHHHQNESCQSSNQLTVAPTSDGPNNNKQNSSSSSSSNNNNSNSNNNKTTMLAKHTTTTTTNCHKTAPAVVSTTGGNNNLHRFRRHSHGHMSYHQQQRNNHHHHQHHNHQAHHHHHHHQVQHHHNGSNHHHQQQQQLQHNQHNHHHHHGHSPTGNGAISSPVQSQSQSNHQLSTLSGSKVADKSNLHDRLAVDTGHQQEATTTPTISNNNNDNACPGDTDNTGASDKLLIRECEQDNQQATVTVAAAAVSKANSASTIVADDQASLMQHSEHYAGQQHQQHDDLDEVDDGNTSKHLYNRHHHHHVKGDDTKVKVDDDHHHHHHHHHHNHDDSDDDDDDEDDDGDSDDDDDEGNKKWPTGFITQLRVLTSRNFIDGKARMLSKLNWIQSIGLGIIAGAIWFQVKRTEETMNDLKGWMYFSTMYWMMFALFNAITSFPAEYQVVNKERMAGSYRLSAYYLAKMIGELPLVIALPSAFHIISYPLLGCHNLATFLSLWAFAILNAVVAQSVGMFIGSTFKDLELSITIAALYSTSTMLFGGFYSSTIPPWLSWLRYGSVVYYGYLNMQIIELGSSPPLTCALKNSKYPSCQVSIMSSTDMIHTTATTTTINETAIATVANINNNNNNQLQLITNEEPHYISNSDILVGLDPMSPNDIPYSVWLNTLCLIVFLLAFRIAGYLILRIYHKPT